jgi:hypothetical protein
MKFLKLVVALCVIGGFAVNTAQSQAIVIKDQYWALEWTISEAAHMVITPEGDINLWFEWQLREGDPLIPEKGTVTLMLNFHYRELGLKIPGTVKINSNGMARGNAHWPPEY